jgi:hypothetical protein
MSCYSVAEGNHLGLRGLPGGGRSLAKPVFGVEFVKQLTWRVLQCLPVFLYARLNTLSKLPD